MMGNKATIVEFDGLKINLEGARQMSRKEFISAYEFSRPNFNAGHFHDKHVKKKKSTIGSEDV